MTREMHLEGDGSSDSSSASSADSSDAEETSTVDDRPHPFERYRWWRLAFAFVFSMICAGTMPGASAFVPLFVDAGVGKSQCSSHDVCDEQYILVSAALSAGTALSVGSVLFTGFVFDRFGGNVAGTAGALIVCLGLLLVQVPLIGARLGHDAQTAGFFVWALLVMDIGTQLNSWCIYGMLWHFQDFQTAVVSGQQASYAATAVLPIVMSAVMDATGLPLFLVFALWLALGVVSCFGCWCIVPSKAEYEAQARRVLGSSQSAEAKIPFCSALRSASAALCQHRRMHVPFILACGAGMSFFMLFVPLSSDYGRLMFNSKKAGTTLSQLFAVLSGVNGALITPVISFLTDLSGSAAEIFLVLNVLILALSCFCVATPTWRAQQATCALLSLFASTSPIFYVKYALAFAGSNFGVFYGLFSVYVTIAALPFISLTYAWISILPSEELDHLRIPLTSACVIGTVAYASAAVYILCVGLPSEPPTQQAPLEKKETELEEETKHDHHNIAVGPLSGSGVAK